MAMHNHIACAGLIVGGRSMLSQGLHEEPGDCRRQAAGPQQDVLTRDLFAFPSGFHKAVRGPGARAIWRIEKGSDPSQTGMEFHREVAARGLTPFRERWRRGV